MNNINNFKVKFLVPEFDKDRWAENLKSLRDLYKISNKDIGNSGIVENSEQNVSQYMYRKSVPSYDILLSLCRFFNESPDYLFFAKPKWIECEIKDISNFHIYGKFENTFYITPTNDDYDLNYQKTVFLKEPDTANFSDFHLYGTRYDLIEKEQNGKVIYRIPRVNREKTTEKIFKLLDEYGLSRKNYQKLVGISPSSVTNLKNGNNEWTYKYIYKLSWILNKPFEDLLAIDYFDSECTKESLFDPIVFLEHYVSDEEKNLISPENNYKK